MRVLRSNPTNRRRSGVVMVLFALLVFVLLGFAALTVDVGSAFLAQGQMQNAVDTAAIEGVRMRDHNFEQWYSNQARRQRASDMVRWCFDDNFDGNSDAYQFTVGPFQPVVGGSGPDNIGASIPALPPDPDLDDPQLELNYANRTYGDMLSGTYLPVAAHQEGADYVRPDFLPGQSADGGNRLALGFLVRMRRTSQPNPLDDVENVSSANPGVPYIFGLGTAIHQDPEHDYNPRTQGITVRATAISAAAPTLSVSYSPCRDNSLVPDPLMPAAPIMGYYGVAIRGDFWKAITARTLGAGWNNDGSSGLYKLEIDAASGGLKLVDLQPTQTWATPFLGQVVAALVQDGRSLGDELAPIPLAQFQNGADPQEADEAHCRWLSLVQSGPFMERGYVGIYEPIEELDGTLTPRIVGYGFGKLNYVAGVPASAPSRLQFSPALGQYFNDVDSWCGQQCASPHLSTDAETLDAEVWRRVFEHLEDLIYDIPTDTDERYDVGHIRRGTLMSATLVR